jgi:hypothetical protein
LNSGLDRIEERIEERIVEAIAFDEPMSKHHGR